MLNIHVVKRADMKLWKVILLYLGAIVIALGLGACVLLALGVDPIRYYSKMFTMGMVGNRIAYKSFENYLRTFVPLLITSSALAIAFKMRFWNIGGEGQFILGAVAATTVAFKLGTVLPQPILLLVMALAAMIAAGLYGMVTAVLKVKLGTNETLLTLMFNYIALYFLIYLGETKADWNFFLDPRSNRPIFNSFKSIVTMPAIKIGKFSLSFGVFLAIAVCVFMFVYLKYTKHGYEISVVGDSAGTARYAGMRVNKIVVRTVFLSAALIGLAGMTKVTTAGILSTSITDNVGWTGVIVAWLAKLHPIGIFVVSALISVLQYGSIAANSTFSAVDANFANMLQGILLFSVLAADFFIRFRLARTKQA